MTSTIILYDIPSDIPGSAWSKNTWKVRFALNYKGLPYKTEWVAFPDIEAHCKKLGIPPTGKTAWGGEDHYTLPAIYDPTTNKYLAESFIIAKYLEETYPDTPRIFPNGTIGLQEAFTDAFDARTAILFRFMAHYGLSHLDSRTQEYLRRTREKAIGKKLEELMPTGEAAVQDWRKVEEGLQKVEEWYAQTDEKGPFILGNVVSWGDFVVAGHLIWAKLVSGEGSKEWKAIASWNNGRWAKLLDSLDKYSARN
ncbi:hypothetical protein D9613_007611 [Agrocybe pediades]|uniref:GST N-terminal domain-containing protein n=1 Tax=Agrocybe pediades TaxID=84607 RepID=A0A8H4QN68_9AGAR|nr:hypothetical protein D9613_007611 [Agrocybe pediades]